MSDNGQVADVATLKKPPGLPRGFSVRGINGLELHVWPRKYGFSHDFKLMLRVGNNTANVKSNDIDSLIDAVQDNFCEAPGFQQRNFTGGASLSVFGGTIDGQRCVSLLCGGQTVRLDADSTGYFLAETMRIRIGLDQFKQSRRTSSTSYREGVEHHVSV